MTTQLDIVASKLDIDVDTMDVQAIAEIFANSSHTPKNMTSNQAIVHAAITSEANKELVETTVKQYGESGWEEVYNQIAVRLCKNQMANLQEDGVTMLQTSTVFSYDVQKTVDHARKYIAAAEAIGIPKSRMCIKIPTTGPGMVATKILLEDNIRVLGTTLFGVHQALAASQAGCLFVAPYFNEIKAHQDLSFWPRVNDPAVEHPSSSRIIHVLDTYRRLYNSSNGKRQPRIMGAGYLSASEVVATAEMGIANATISAPILRDLIKTPSSDPLVNTPRPNDVYANASPLPARLTSLLKVDLLDSTWDGTYYDGKGESLDWLAENGKRLDKAIEKDLPAKTRLADALKFFVQEEEKSRAFLEELIEKL